MTARNRHPGVGRAGTAAEYAARIPALRAAVRTARAALAREYTVAGYAQLVAALRRLDWYRARHESPRALRKGTNLSTRSLNRPFAPQQRRPDLSLDRL